jgi:spermidine synthase
MVWSFGMDKPVGNQSLESTGAMDLWVEERHREIMATRFRVHNVLVRAQTPFQQVEIVDTAGHGRMLLNDGLVMLSERDEFVYHDMIAHVPLFVHPNPRRVLIIGGGDGGTAREVLRHSEVERCLLVEIDKAVVDGCKEHIPQTAACLHEDRVEVLIDDGVRFVKETDERFDVVLVDSTDPIGPAQPLFGAAFYRDVFGLLDDNGIVVAQAESPFYQLAAQKSILKVISSVFPYVRVYNYSNITYPGGLWSFAYASRGLRPLDDFDPKRVLDAGLEFNYYNIDIHRACFALPEFMRRELAQFLNEA